MWQEELPVTLQIAAICNDGWVLASDRRQVDHYPLRTSSSVKKLMLVDGRLAYSVWGNRLAVLAGNELVDAISAGRLRIDNENTLRQGLTALGDLVWRRARTDMENDLTPIDPDPNSQGIVVFFPNRADCFWILGVGRRSFAEVHTDKLPIGDRANPATFFLDRYHSLTMSIDELIFLAAHVICLGETFNSSGVSGLDMIVRRGDTISEQNRGELITLKQRSLELDLKLSDCFHPLTH
jgi:hypothetical protein